MDILCSLLLISVLAVYAFFKLRRDDVRSGYRSPLLTPPTHRYSIHPTKPPWVKQEVIRLKALMPHFGCRKVAASFNRLYLSSRKMNISKSYVANVIRDHQYEIQVLAKKLKHQRPKPVPKNLVWGIDLTGKTDSQGQTHSLLGVVEHASRGCLLIQAVTDKSSITLLRHLLDVVERYGKPKIIRTDNEAVFRSRLFKVVLGLLRIKHQTTDLHCPWQNGRIERLFGTLKARLNHWQVDGIDQLNRALPYFQFWYNHVRPHQHLGDKTPAEVWTGRDVFQQRHNEIYWFEAWEGLLTGYYIPT